MTFNALEDDELDSNWPSSALFVCAVLRHFRAEKCQLIILVMPSSPFPLVWSPVPASLAVQLAAARIWALMLRNSDTFISQSTSCKFLDMLEDLLTSLYTSPVVREHVMDVVAATAYASETKKGAGFRGLWRRVKPRDKPEEGMPFDAVDATSTPVWWRAGLRLRLRDAAHGQGGGTGGGSSSCSRSPSPTRVPAHCLYTPEHEPWNIANLSPTSDPPKTQQSSPGIGVNPTQAEPRPRRHVLVLDNVNPGFNDLGDMTQQHQFIATEVIPLSQQPISESSSTAARDYRVSALYGRPEGGSVEKPPLMSEEFMWKLEEISQAPRPSATLDPALSAMAPTSYSYPQAESYTLSPAIDRRFTRGCAYVTLFTPSKKGLLHDKLLRTRTPPNLLPRLHEGKIVVDPIAGMIQMPGSIPFIQHVEGRPNEIVSMACAHTLAPIRDAYPEVADHVEDLATRLQDATFGTEAKDGQPAMMPIYAIPGLKRNDRSVNASALPEGSFDGSYNLVSTKGEGEGAGVVMPAVQASTPEAAERISEVIQLLHALQREITPRSISKFENDVTEAHSDLNNVVSFGGLEPNATSCQMNVSSGGFDLAHFIGSYQGSWHTDIGDDWTR
ncbi:hypothetical protein B0H17DRAFT_1190410 [Mycena rosella]|uniref:Uncharacterized protein n=1 Tax=Mycena rosella TaxID=1033263 RepID=A0AAD7H312_MYCRO|nr:hypothetical protein B0H17DRAFT_1190410 [Mycena rosella]